MITSRDPVVFQSRGKLHISWVPDDYVTLSTEAFKELIALANGEEINKTCTCGRLRTECPSGQWAGIQRYDTYVYCIKENFGDYGEWQFLLELGIFSTREAALEAIPEDEDGFEYEIVEVKVR